MAAANGEVDLEDEDVGNTFNERRNAHFENLLREKWACSMEGHAVCVPTEDGQHFMLSNHNIRYWVNALCKERATTVNPPHVVFEDIAGGAVWNRKNGTYTVRAVSIPPSREHFHRPVGGRAGSINGSFESRTNSRVSNPDHSMSRAHPTSDTAAALGPGYINNRAIGWLGGISVSGMNFAIDRNHCRSYISCLEKWEKHQPVLGDSERSQVLQMLEEALHMSMPWCSTAINDYGYNIARAVHHWLRTCRDVPATNELPWLIQVQVSLLPILLMKVSRADPLTSDLAYWTLAALKRAPFAVQGLETSATVIWLIARELAYAKCTFQHSWLGIWLLRVVEMSLRVRELSCNEIRAIKELAVRRQEHTDYNTKQVYVWRPWEVALFAQCASQDEWFKDAVLGTHGHSSLVFALDCMLLENRVSQIRWEAIAITLRALAFLSEHEWVAGAIDIGTIRSLLRVLRLNIPKRWFCIRFWAADTMRNFVAHRPQLARILLQENVIPVFEALSQPELDCNLSDQSHPVPPVPPLPPTFSLPPTPHNGTPSPTATSPEHDSNICSSQLPMDGLRTALSSSPEPITPPSGSGNRRFSLKFLTRRTSSSGARHERKSPASIGSDTTHPRPTPTRNDTTSTSSSQNAPRNSRRPPPLIPTPAQERLLKDYRVEAAKRARELAEHVRKWTEYTPDALPTLEPLPRLEVPQVGADVDWLSSWGVEVDA